MNASTSIIRVEEGEKERRYGWGDDAFGATQAIGRLVEFAAGKGPNALQNLLHRVDVPIAEAHMELRQPITNRVSRPYRTRRPFLHFSTYLMEPTFFIYDEELARGPTI